MKAKVDTHRRDIIFEVGDRVYLKLRPYRQKTLARRRNEKLSPRYFGSFEIEGKVGMVAYRLKLPSHSTIHPVFHVSQLKRSIGEHEVVTSTIPQGLTEEIEFRLEPLHVKKIRRDSQGKREVLIEWKELPEHEATWEVFEDLQEQFPDFNLEDKVLLEGGIDREADPTTREGPVRFVYRRKHRADPVEGVNIGSAPDVAPRRLRGA